MNAPDAVFGVGVGIVALMGEKGGCFAVDVFGS